ncbi:MAG: hypothetical protein JO261_10465 [Alphaproteobacteria bacterium]|nr:hypothetical protein [Alphaproteobacteria bacterium]MBV9694108.1 hypothetical protein [Alphaproteobacteria bacterium]
MAVYSFLSAFLFAAPAVAASAHAPQTDAEKTLDKILRTAEGDELILDNVLHRFPVPATKRVDYSKWLTPALIASLQAEQKRLLDQDCGGKYVEGDICGMDYNPLTCAQDTMAVHAYATLSESGDAVTITRAAVAYRMTHTGPGWRLDGIKCKELQFNFP